MRVCVYTEILVTSRSNTQTMAKDWKEQYLEAMEQQGALRERYARKSGLLGRGISVTGQLATGLDETTDRGLLGLRGLLRKDTPSNADLDLAISALELRLKPALTQRLQASQKILAHIQALLSQLHGASQDPASARQVEILQRKYKNSDFSYADLPDMLDGLAGVQQLALTDLLQAQSDQTRADKGSTAASSKSSPSAWSRLFGGAGKSGADDVSPAFQVEPSAAIQAETRPATAAEPQDPVSTGESGDDGAQPLDWKLEPTVRQTLKRLLERVTPPESVQMHYKAARVLINRDLNGYELAPALEHLCEVLLASIQRDQDEFQTFLNQLNLRLQEAFSQLAMGLALTAEETNVTGLLNKAMLAHVGALQSTVASAVDMDDLKSEISNNLDQIVLTIDEHSKEGARRHQRLASELDKMSGRLQAMEESSRVAAEQLEAQKRLAMLDALTQLPNRAAYNQRGAEELARWQRHHGDLCLAVCDVDWFKKVNDQHGHGAGDLVLQALATTLKTRLRKSDFISRFGGEEFVILMPETNAAQAVEVLNKLREVVAQSPVNFEQIAISITVSLGITAFQGKDNLESAFTRADRALYDAKDAGRNCCRVITDAAEGSVAAPSVE
ncbi:MAG: diguanylate cyclase [Cyclobacteriaceae bacterium]|jgi:diguanylate cyclase